MKAPGGPFSNFEIHDIYMYFFLNKKIHCPVSDACEMLLVKSSVCQCSSLRYVRQEAWKLR